MKTSTFLLLVLLILTSCQPKTDFNELNLENYFFKLVDFKTPKVLIYDVDSAGIQSHIYYQIEQSASDQLKITKYDNLFRPSEYQVFTYKPEGIYLSSGGFMDDHKNGEWTAIDIVKPYVFPLLDANRTIATENVFYYGEKRFKVRDLGTMKFEKVITRHINNEEHNIIVAKAKVTRTFVESGDTADTKIRTEAWYLENFGVYKLSAHFPKWHYTETFKENISFSEFEELRFAD